MTTIHPYAFKAAMAAEAANEQGKFWEMHDLLFENQDHLTEADLLKYAEELGLDMDKFKAGLTSTKNRDLVNAQIQQGNIDGVNATPTFFVNGKKVDNWGNLRNAILAELN